MCLILLAWRAHPDYPLVVAANRDEFFARRTAAADFWSDAPHVLAGRDLEADGTWLGVTRQGRFAALTNYRDPARNRSVTSSRGELVSRFLTGAQRGPDYLAELEARADRYNGFNLIFGDARELWCFSNCGEGERRLEPGIYGLSNHLLDTPWPKVVQGKSALGAALQALPEVAPLFDLLCDDRIAPDEALPRTGVSLEWERLLSAAFIRMPGYGTRSSTVLVMDRQPRLRFVEQTYLPDGVQGERVDKVFPLEAPSRRD
ncbi:MAG: NRDE family protein [Betaproteobacteria bacterium]|nr:NRDE family protein [Betaproteobacteria bacterium]